MNNIVHVGNTILISYPKSGRTWVRLMLSELTKLLGGSPTQKELIYYQHAGSETRGEELNGRRPKFYELKVDVQRWSGKNIILLVRDPRDILVSLYLHAIKRENTNLWADISEFIRDESWGVQSIVAFYNNWYDARDIANKLLLLRYEDLHVDCIKELQKIVEFCDLSDKVTEDMLVKVRDFGSFDNMRKIELSGREHNYLSNRGALVPGNVKDPESYKVRKGKVGGYRDYLSDTDIGYLDEHISKLGGWYGY